MTDGLEHCVALDMGSLKLRLYSNSWRRLISATRVFGGEPDRTYMIHKLRVVSK
jgi:hypothetical protein